jgi:DNA-directed RNA polymerase specialized sigma24 family protein
MSFPQTQLTLIQRLAKGASQADWREFLDDYWEPVCRFSRGRSGLSREDSEDVATEVFEILYKNQLLERWSQMRSAKLRTLICSVIRNVLSNRLRVEAGRARLVREHGGQLNRYVAFEEDSEEAVAPNEQLDAFYAAWVEGTLHATVEGLLAEYDRAGKGDYFRVFYGSLCEQLPMPEIADWLQIPVTAAYNYHRHVRDRLAERLKEKVREHVLRYSGAEDPGEEFLTEWTRFGEHLQLLGGLETAVRRVYADANAPLNPPANP